MLTNLLRLEVCRNFSGESKHTWLLYHLWDEDHKRYLATGPEGGYDLEMYKKRCVKETTDKFKSTSGQIIKIVEDIKGLEGSRAPELAELIQKVQDLESMKLRFTVDVQLAKQENQVRSLSHDPLSVYAS